jgi:membrane fusion protein (multidrug efflux system)
MLDRKELRDHPLRIGLSTSVRVDISDRNGAPLGAPTANHEMRGDPGAEGVPETEQTIARILEENGG